MFSAIADDFTGACDAGVQFRKHGLRTFVSSEMDLSDSFFGKSGVSIIDTESRNVSAEEAYCKVKHSLKFLADIGSNLAYKKIDSTLRGNLGAEIDAVLDELRVKALVVAPAFPQHGRTTVNGQMLVYGIPLEKTEFALDPVNPVKKSDISSLINIQSDREIANIRLSSVRGSIEQLEERIRGLITDRFKVIVADAETQSDLSHIADASFDTGALPCGSAGLANEIARLLSLRTHRKGVLIISGSLSDVTLRQIERIKEVLGTETFEIDLSSLNDDVKRKSKIEDLVSRIGNVLRDERDAVLRLPVRRIEFQTTKTDSINSLSRREDTDKLLSILSDVFENIMTKYEMSGLVMVGGDTAVRMLKGAGSNGVSLEEEVLPGMPLCRIMGGKLSGMRVVTKAGGFGDEDALVDIINYMKRNSEN